MLLLAAALLPVGQLGFQRSYQQRTSMLQVVVDGAVMMVPENLMGRVDEVNDRPVGKPQEKVLMNIAASFPSVKKPRFIVQEKSRQ
jgi:hypothetical protein